MKTLASFSVVLTVLFAQLCQAGNYLGCFVAESGYEFSTGSNDKMTNTLCVATCATRGFLYASTGRNYCYCHNNLTSPQSNGCDTPCPGNLSEMCGGFSFVHKSSVNSVYRVGAPSQKLPDLVIISAVQDPPGANLSSGRPIHYYVRVTNSGNSPVSGYILVRGPGNATSGFDGLRPGEEKTVIVPLHVYSSGPGGTTISNILFTVDPENVNSESNEDNNTVGPFSVTLY